MWLKIIETTLNTINQSINTVRLYTKKTITVHVGYQSERKLKRQGTEIQLLHGRLKNNFPFKLR